MDRKIVKWVIVGYMVLLTLTTVTPLVSAEKSVEKVNWEDVGMEIGTNDKGILSDLSGEKLQPLWKPTPEKGHWNMTEVAAKKVGWIPDKYIGTLCKYSGDADYCPDYFDPVYIFETLDWDNSQQCKHAYFVDPFDRVLKSRADEMCQHYYDLAMTEFKNGDPEEAFEYLGYAIHFLQDVGNPMHTALAPMRNIALHTTYENYVDDNWNKFYPDAQMANSWFSFTPSDSVVALATSSNKKVGTLMSDVAIGYYTRVDEITHQRIEETTNFTIGFYDYVYNNLPNLTITSDVSIGGYTSNEDAHFTAGQTVTLSVNVQNLGGTVDNVKVTFFNDEDVIGTYTISSIDSGEIKPASVSWKFTSPHVIRAVVDAENRIFEQNEKNNEKVEKLPDLYIGGVYTDANPPYNFYAYVKNIVGGDTAYNIVVRFYDGAVDDNNNLIGNTSYTIPSLSGGNTHTATCSGTSISYGLQVTVDQDFSGSPKGRGLIGEIDENNNKEGETSTVISGTVTWTGTRTETKSVNIVSGGKLIIYGATVNMACAGNGQHIIRVCEGGELIVKNNAKIQKTATGDYFEFIIYGKATIENSEITGLYFGLWICSDDVTISGTTIQNTRQSGIWCFSSSPTITGNTIDVSMGGAITSFNHSNPQIIGNNIYTEGGGIGVLLFSNPVIKNNVITVGVEMSNCAGIGVVDYSSPHIEENTIQSSVGDGISCWGNSNANIIGNTIQNSQRGIMLFNSSAIITNNLIQHNLAGIGCMDQSDAIIKNNHIILKEDLSAPDTVFKIGIYCEESNPTITKNTIESDGDPSNSDLTFGIYLYYSSATIKDNSLNGIQGAGSSALGIYASHSSSLIINNTVSSCSRGIECNNGDIIVVNSTLTSIDEDFLITSSSASITMINTTFDQNSYTNSFYSSTSVLNVKWYLDVGVVDSNGNPVPNANVIVKDKYNTEIYNGNTDADGYVKNIICAQYTQNAPGESAKTYYTPHDISAQKGSETASIGVTMDVNQGIGLTLNVIPDFTLSSSDITLADNGIFATIWNNGKAYGVDVSVSVLFDDMEIATQTLPIVPPDGESTTTALLWRDVFFNPDGTHTFEINIDPQNTIDESNEANNHASNTLTVTVTPAEVPTLQSPSDGSTVYNPVTFQIYSTDPMDVLCYRIELSNNNFATVLKAFNQLESLKGWSKETYISGETASYTVQVEDALPSGTYQWRAQAFNCVVWSDLSSIRTFTVSNSPPNTPSTPSGPTSGTIGSSYTYSTSATDPNGDNVKYTFDWGDGTTTTTGFVASGSTGFASHSWSSAGTYYVKAYATDSNGASSGWSGSLTVTITEGDGHKIILPIIPGGPLEGIIDGYYIDGFNIGIGGHIIVHGVEQDGVLEHLPGWERGFCINMIIDIIRDWWREWGGLPGIFPHPWYCDASNIYQTYYVNVSNPFNSTIIVNLSTYGVPEGWDAYLSNYSITLGPDEYVIVTLTVVVPKTTTIGQTTIWVLGTIQDYDYLFMYGINVTVGELPVAIARVESPYSIVLENDILVFNGSFSYDPDGTIIGYEWDFGDETNGTGMAVEHSYENTGNYVVTLTVRDNYNLTNSTTFVVSVEYHSFEVSVQQINTEIMPGETSVYMINIENTGTLSDTYGLRMNGLDSSWSYPDNVYVGVSAGGSITLYLKVTIPSDYPLLENTTYDFTITVTCMHDEIMMSNAPLTYTDDETLTVIATKESKTRYMINEVEELMVVLDGVDIQQGVKNSLQNKLENALDKLNTALDDILNGDENHANNMLNTAQNQINAFINEVEAQCGKKISEEDADVLTGMAQIIIEHINNTTATPL